MRNTRQGPLGFEGNDAPTLQQLMETMRALQEANKQYKLYQEQIQREAKAEQERLMAGAVAEAMAEAKVEQEKLIVEVWVEQVLRQGQWGIAQELTTNWSKLYSGARFECTAKRSSQAILVRDHGCSHTDELHNT